MTIEITYYSDYNCTNLQTIRLDMSMPDVVIEDPFRMVREYNRKHGTSYLAGVRCIYNIKEVEE